MLTLCSDSKLYFCTNLSILEPLENNKNNKYLGTGTFEALCKENETVFNS